MKVSYPAKKTTSLQNGFYPIGYYHCWHGGIHIEGIENKTPIKAIAEGKIIAFRYNQELKRVKTKGGKEFSFSNNFVLIRHDYESSEDTKMTFYSLYQHLSFGSQQQKEENKPKEQKQENTYTVKVKTPQQESGVLSLDSSTFIPLYSKVEIQTEDEKQGIYKVVFEGKTIVIPREKKDKKTLNNEGQVVFWGNKLKDKGLLLYSEARKNAPTKGVVKDGEKITILNKFEVQGKDKKHTWYKIKYQEKEGFVLEEHLATKPSENKENQKKDTKKTTTKPKSLPKFLENQIPKDEVVTCNIDVKGGEFIGWVGRQGLFNNPNYVATHIEVFTPDNGEDFISNKKDDGKNEKFYAQLPAKTILKNYIKRILFIPQSTKVKILAVEGDCVQLETLENLVKITDEQQKYQQRWYVDFVLRVIGEEKFRVDTHFSKEKKIYWVDKDNFKGVSIKKGDEIQLPSTISEVFFELPTSNIKKQEVIDKKVTVDLRKKTKKFDNHKWYYVVCHYHDKTGNRIERKGWIKDSDKLEKFSAYHWDKFGFKTYEAENHRMYPIKSVNNYEGTSEFIKKIIALIDKNKDGKIQNEELQASYNKPELSHIFSRMVCKHKSEWSYKWAKIKSDYEKFIKYHYPKAKQEYVNERLDEIQAKYDALYDFWDKLNFKTDTFWYFEPFGWVEQMKRVFSNGELIFPFKKIPLNHPKGFKNDSYKKYDYTKHETNAATFGYERGTNRIHAARDLYYEVGEPIYAIADGIVTSIHYYYDTTYAIVIEHDYEYKEGHKLIVLYGEVSKEGIKVKVGDKVVQGQQIAEVGLLYNEKKKKYVEQPAPDRRGMLHIEMYTGEAIGALTSKMTKYEEMLYAKSDGYNRNRQFQRRKDLFDPLELLEKMLENSINQGLIK